MSKKNNLINNIIVLVIIVSLFLTVALINNVYSNNNFFIMLLLIVAGSLIAGFINALIHEMGHLLSAKSNNFEIISVSVWFLKWVRQNNKFRFSFTSIGEEAGSSVVVPKKTDNLIERYKKVSIGGIKASFILMMLSIPTLFTAGVVAQWLYLILASFLPISAYYFFGSILPMISDNVKNDGAVYFGLKNKDKSMIVATNILAIHSEIYSGKTPGEVDENLYFDLPQLPEDDLNFITLLDARYAYYLDREDYENAKKVSERLLSLIDYMPKSYQFIVKTNALYNACTFDKNEDLADSLMYELDKFINNINNALTIRAKLAYLTYIVKDTDNLADFYNKGLREANKEPLEGLRIYEKKLIEKINADINT